MMGAGSGQRSRGTPRRGAWTTKYARRRDGASVANDTAAGSVRLFGLHAVEAALRNPNRIVGRVALTENAERRLQSALAARGLTSERVTPRDLDRLLGADTVHQGALLEAAPLPEAALEDLAHAAASGPLIVLDQVTDPHNVGAILRSAAVFGAAGMILPRRHSPPLDGALAKAASGALEVVPVGLAQNLARALAELKEHHVAVIGLDGEGQYAIEDEPFAGPLAFVLGGEGRGLRRLTRDSCDRICRIRCAGPFASLNVSNAAAVALHVASLRRSR